MNDTKEYQFLSCKRDTTKQHYRIFVHFMTQRNRDFRVYGVPAESLQLAELIAVGQLMEDEKNGKDRYLKILGVHCIGDMSLQQAVEEYYL